MNSCFIDALKTIFSYLDSCRPFSDDQSPTRVAVAYSGGLDSTVLLDWCAAWVKAHPKRYQLYAFHIHHGISPYADNWLNHAQKQSLVIALDHGLEDGITFDSERIHVLKNPKKGLEAAARSARYQALGSMASKHRIDVLFTAHHQDDQAETVLLHLLRGTGLKGVGGMPLYGYAPGLLGHSILIARPLLNIKRVVLEDALKQQGRLFVEDESNHNTHYRRNALRQDVLPVLARHFPDYATKLARAAQHLQSVDALLSPIVDEAYQQCVVPGTSHLHVTALKALPAALVGHVLRHWLDMHHLSMPSTAQLEDIHKQLLYAREDAQIDIPYGGVHLRRYHDHLCMVREPSAFSFPSCEFIWQGEPYLFFREWEGRLYFEHIRDNRAGIGEDWLQNQTLTLRAREGGERLKLAPNRPTRTLKQHYQDAFIPYWMRARLPLLFAADTLIFAAGIGAHAPILQDTGKRMALRWESM